MTKRKSENISENFRFQGTSVHLTYKTHIPKQSLHELINQKPKADIRYIKIAWESADDSDPYDHTHCFVQWEKKIDVKKHSIWDFEEIHPNIKPANTIEHQGNTDAYLDKEDPEPYKWGTFRGDKWQELIHSIQAKESWAAVICDAKLAPTVSKCMVWAKQVWDSKPRGETLCVIKDEANLRPWQLAALRKLKCQNNRGILWIVGDGIGKTQFGQYLEDKYGAFYCEGGKTHDMKHLWQGEEYNVFNFAKGYAKEYWCTTLMENIKDGRVTSGKYEGGRKIALKQTKVVVFSNEFPDDDWFVGDRLDIMHITNDISTQF